jgi:hypothetical protein
MYFQIRDILKEAKMTHRKAHSEKTTIFKTKNLSGVGGTRQGYVAENEIEDMTLFDEDPGKDPSRETKKDAKKRW